MKYSFCFRALLISFIAFYPQISIAGVYGGPPSNYVEVNSFVTHGSSSSSIYSYAQNYAKNQTPATDYVTASVWPSYSCSGRTGCHVAYYNGEIYVYAPPPTQNLYNSSGVLCGLTTGGQSGITWWNTGNSGCFLSTPP